jgi:hypothetical protein
MPPPFSASEHACAKTSDAIAIPALEVVTRPPPRPRGSAGSYRRADSGSGGPRDPAGRTPQIRESTHNSYRALSASFRRFPARGGQ